MRTTWLEGTNDLVDVETEVTPHVAVVVLNIVPIKLTHDELRIEPEGSLANKPLRD